jgi:acetyl esterase
MRMTGPVASPQPSPEMAAYLGQLDRSELPWRDISALRTTTRAQSMAVRGQFTPVWSVTDAVADGVGVRLYRPDAAADCVLVWAHGGGWVLGDLDTSDDVARILANRARCCVVSVDYRLAPEHPFPAGLDDLRTVVRWATTRFRRVAVGGDSAGGNLAAATCLASRDEGLDLAMQLLVYPVLDHHDSGYKSQFRETYTAFAGIQGFGLDACQRIDWLWDQYDPMRSHRDEPLAAPLHARDLTGLPPTTLILAEHDVLRGEAEEYATRLCDAGVDVQVHPFPGQIHGFFQMLAVTPDAQRALERAADAVRRGFTSSEPLTTPNTASSKENS